MMPLSCDILHAIWNLKGKVKARVRDKMLPWYKGERNEKGKRIFLEYTCHSPIRLCNEDWLSCIKHLPCYPNS